MKSQYLTSLKNYDKYELFHFGDLVTENESIVHVS